MTLIDKLLQQPTHYLNGVPVPNHEQEVLVYIITAPFFIAMLIPVGMAIKLGVDRLRGKKA